jgi:26S proteasome regulatory subunit N2
MCQIIYSLHCNRHLLILAQCINKYIEFRQEQVSTTSQFNRELPSNSLSLQQGSLKDSAVISRISPIIEALFDKCFADKQFQQAVGIAIESERLDIVEKALNLCGCTFEILEYVIFTVLSFVTRLSFRNEVIHHYW